MPLQTTKNIWHNGKMIPWQDANIHIMSHVVHYGSSIFEGIRAYAQPGGASIFRLPEHMARFRDSGHIYRMPLGFTVDQLSQAVVDLVEANGVAPCYIRPVAFRGYGEAGINPAQQPGRGLHRKLSLGQVRPRERRRQRLRLQLEPPRAQHHAHHVQSRRQLSQTRS